MFNSTLNKPDGTIQQKTDPGRNPQSDAGCAGRPNQRNDSRFPCQQPQKQDETCAHYMYPCLNELSYSDVTPRKELFKHPVVEQLAMTGTRLAIPEQGHQKSTNNLQWRDSRPVSEELPRQTQHHSWWSQVWETPTFRMTQLNQCRQSPMIALSRRESFNPAHERSSSTSGRRRERLADAPGSVTPEPPE